MLFGSREIQNKIIEHAHECEKERNIKIVYGALVGSVSKGIQLYDSDYDTRFLYVDENTFNNPYVPRNVEESAIIYRKKLEGTSFEKIPCWELSSFFNYLADPAIDGHFSVGLYNVFGWTFCSPYSWDPYGLKEKIMPIANNICNTKYLVEYHKDLLLNGYNDMNITAKKYLGLIHAALTIEWVYKYHSFPPTYLYTLLDIAEENMRNEVLSILTDMQKEALCFCHNNIQEESHISAYHVWVERRACIDKYLFRVVEQINKETFQVDFELQNDMLVNKVSLIRDIAYHSIYNEQQIAERI